MALDITVTHEADKCIVCVNGEVDVSNAAELRSALEAALTGGTSKITADFSDVSYIDSTGLGAFISIYKHIKEKGEKLVITGLKPHIKKIFLITDLDKVFEIEG